jgi:hypothetical protein
MTELVIRAETYEYLSMPLFGPDCTLTDNAYVFDCFPP